MNIADVCTWEEADSHLGCVLALRRHWRAGAENARVAIMAGNPLRGVWK